MDRIALSDEFNWDDDVDDEVEYVEDKAAVLDFDKEYEREYEPDEWRGVFDEPNEEEEREQDQLYEIDGNYGSD